MSAILAPGHWYRSKAVLNRLGTLNLVNKPHVTPDGYVLMVFDAGDRGVVQGAMGIALDGQKIGTRIIPPCLVPSAEDTTDADGKNIPGGDLLCVVTTMIKGQWSSRIERVEIPPGSVTDLELLDLTKYYDHLPTYRKAVKPA